jgi:hypothetical protein
MPYSKLSVLIHRAVRGKALVCLLSETHVLFAAEPQATPQACFELNPFLELLLRMDS